MAPPLPEVDDWHDPVGTVVQSALQVVKHAWSGPLTIVMATPPEQRASKPNWYDGPETTVAASQPEAEKRVRDHIGAAAAGKVYLVDPKKLTTHCPLVYAVALPVTGVTAPVQSRVVYDEAPKVVPVTAILREVDAVRVTHSSNGTGMLEYDATVPVQSEVVYWKAV